MMPDNGVEPEHKPTATKSLNATSWMTEGMMLAALAPLAYVLVFTYEYAQCSYWGIPASLIEVNLTTVLVAFGSLVGLVVILLVVLQVAMLATPFPDTPLKASFFRLALMIAGSATFVAIYWDTDWSIMWVPVGAVVLFAFAEFVFPVLTQWKTKGYMNKLAKQEESEPEVVVVSDIPKVVFGKTAQLALLLAIVLIALTGAYGSAQAIKQHEFPMVEGRSSAEAKLVVLKIYGPNLICTPLSPNTSSIEREFVILELSELKGRSIKIEDIGRLSPADKED